MYKFYTRMVGQVYFNVDFFIALGFEHKHSAKA